jgi:hypothetical protein
VEHLKADISVSQPTIVCLPVVMQSFQNFLRGDSYLSLYSLLAIVLVNVRFP